MEATYSQARQSLKTLMDRAVADREVVMVRRRHGGDVVGLPRFRGQVDRSHAMTLRLSIDDQPNQDQAPVHASAEAGGY